MLQNTWAFKESYIRNGANILIIESDLYDRKFKCKNFISYLPNKVYFKLERDTLFHTADYMMFIVDSTSISVTIKEAEEIGEIKGYIKYMSSQKKQLLKKYTQISQ